MVKNVRPLTAFSAGMNDMRDMRAEKTQEVEPVVEQARVEPVTPPTVTVETVETVKTVQTPVSENAPTLEVIPEDFEYNAQLTVRTDKRFSTSVRMHCLSQGVSMKIFVHAALAYCMEHGIPDEYLDAFRN